MRAISLLMLGPLHVVVQARHVVVHARHVVVQARRRAAGLLGRCVRPIVHSCCDSGATSAVTSA
jgi:hypothetical protein